MELEHDLDQFTGERRLHSFSGKERNCLFYNQGGTDFSDLSLLSGVDNVSDGRTFVYWDYDHDGWQDIALVNANSPLLNLYRNTIGDSPGSSGEGGAFLALRYVGANRLASPAPDRACRDGYGARVAVDLGPMRLTREHRCGEGFCAQNSATMIIGIGENLSARAVTVRWPAGTSQTIHDVPRGALLTAFENAAESADGSGFDVAVYVNPVAALPSSRANHPSTPTDQKNFTLPGLSTSTADRNPPQLRLYTTMATWCAACQKHLPQLSRLAQDFDTDQVKVYGVPIDPQDTLTKLKDYEATFGPDYQLLNPLATQQRNQVQSLLRAELGSAILPSTIVTDGRGQLLQVIPGIPTVSQMRKWGTGRVGMNGS